MIPRGDVCLTILSPFKKLITIPALTKGRSIAPTFIATENGFVAPGVFAT